MARRRQSGKTLKNPQGKALVAKPTGLRFRPLSTHQHFPPQGWPAPVISLFHVSPTETDFASISMG